MCRTHRFPGERECSGCVMEIRAGELTSLRRQEQNLRSFLRLLQFVFLVFSILFIASKLGVAETVDILRDNVIMDHLIFFLCISVVGYAVFYGILYYQRKRINHLDQKTRSEFRRFI